LIQQTQEVEWVRFTGLPGLACTALVIKATGLACTNITSPSSHRIRELRVLASRSVCGTELILSNQHFCSIFVIVVSWSVALITALALVSLYDGRATQQHNRQELSILHLHLALQHVLLNHLPELVAAA